MRIGLDVMGGDFAPDAIVDGAVEVLDFLSEDERVVLIGDEGCILAKLQELGVDPSRYDIVHTTQSIGMGDTPTRAVMEKKDSSISRGFAMLANKEIDGFCSAGNTGAMLVGASYSVNVIPGVHRPALATIIPTINNNSSVLLDVGLNPDCKVDVLLQYAILGSVFAKHVLQIENPTVKLLNIGAEESKGTPVVKAAYELMKAQPDINFQGNIEANELYMDSTSDVIVCDGFVGNIILKQTEAFHRIYKMKNITDQFFERIDFENIGGTPIVGINANVVIGHGVSRRKAVRNMILQTRRVIQANLANKIKEAI